MEGPTSRRCHAPNRANITESPRICRFQNTEITPKIIAKSPKISGCHTQIILNLSSKVIHPSSCWGSAAAPPCAAPCAAPGAAGAGAAKAASPRSQRLPHILAPPKPFKSIQEETNVFGWFKSWEWIDHLL